MKTINNKEGGMMKKILILAVFFVLLNLYFINAADDISIKIAPIKSTVTPIQNATYSVTVANNGNKDMQLEFRYFGVDWRVSPEKIVIPAFSTKSITLTLVPQQPYIDDKPEVVRIKITSQDGIYSNDFFLDVDVLNYLEILDQSNGNLIIPDPIDPRKPTVINVKLVNIRDASLENINVKLESPFFEQKKIVSISPEETSMIDFQIELKEATKFGSYPITALVTLDSRVLANFSKQMKIGSYPNILEKQSPKSGFLLNVIEITKKNEGNTVSYETITKKLTSFERVFTKTIPKPSTVSKTESGYLYAWNLQLEPGQTKTIAIETNYRGFFALLVILIAIALVVYFVTKRDISIKKKLVSNKKEQDGSSTVKISITLKNKGFKKIHNVKVMDRVPKIAETPHEFGTAHPKVAETPQGVQLIWEITTLSSNEEKIFTYKARSKLQIIGKSTIPSAVAKYVKGNRTLTVSSNPEQLFS